MAEITIEEQINRWTKTGLLRGVAEQFVEGTTYMLENQRAFNQAVALPVFFRRISIPLVLRVFPQFDHNIIPLSSAFYNPATASVRGMGISCDPPTDTLGRNSLDTEAEWLVECAEKVIEEINTWLKTLNNIIGVKLFQFGLTADTSTLRNNFLLYYQLEK